MKDGSSDASSLKRNNLNMFLKHENGGSHLIYPHFVVGSEIFRFALEEEKDLFRDCSSFPFLV